MKTPPVPEAVFILSRKGYDGLSVYRSAKQAWAVAKGHVTRGRKRHGEPKSLNEFKVTEYLCVRVLFAEEDSVNGGT